MRQIIIMNAIIFSLFLPGFSANAMNRRNKLPPCPEVVNSGTPVDSHCEGKTIVCPVAVKEGASLDRRCTATIVCPVAAIQGAYSE